MFKKIVTAGLISSAFISSAAIAGQCEMNTLTQTKMNWSIHLASVIGEKINLQTDFETCRQQTERLHLTLLPAFASNDRMVVLMTSASYHDQDTIGAKSPSYKIYFDSRRERSENKIGKCEAQSNSRNNIIEPIFWLQGPYGELSIGSNLNRPGLSGEQNCIYGAILAYSQKGVEAPFKSDGMTVKFYKEGYTSIVSTGNEFQGIRNFVGQQLAKIK